MKQAYDDILQATGQAPLWYDENGVPHVGDPIAPQAVRYWIGDKP